MMIRRPDSFSWFQRPLYIAVFVSTLLVAGCGVFHHPSQSETRPESESDTLAATADSSGELTYIPRDNRSDRQAEPGQPPTLRIPKAVGEPSSTEAEYPPEDDATWQAFHQADEFYQMGVTANRESSWEEAQYYFEKALKTLANVDVETESDSALTPEAVKYNTLLDNIVSDYRTTLRSLGRLDENAAPSAIVERFGDLETKLGNDTMHVYKSERSPVSYDLPVVMNGRVKASIVYFQTVANEAFRRYLGRSRKYAVMFKRILRENGLPEDLIYLSLVESGYNPHAYSFARAMGLWQFIAETGKLYGLDRNWWVDERKDPEKSTMAAAKFLKELYEEFGSWELAMAAYNGGPGRVERTIAQQRTSDFWKLRLRQQTMDYVPLIYAAIIIGKEPEKYGFGDVAYEPELTWDSVYIDRCLDLRVVANQIGCTIDTLKFLNPELLRNYTPPNTKNYKLRLPAGFRQSFVTAYENMPEAKGASFAHHKVRRRETLASIANRYGISQYAILDANNLSKGAHLKSGMDLVIPVPAGNDGSDDRDGGSDAQKSRQYKTEKSTYSVRPGDTMWDIARAFGISADELRQVNYLNKDDRIFVGQKLRIPSYAKSGPQLASVGDDSIGRESASQPNDAPDSHPSSSGSNAKSGSAVAQPVGANATYVVKEGDTIWDIAKKFGTTASDIREQNGLNKTARIFIGQQLIIAPSAGKDDNQFVIYKIRNGDTLSRIAQKYKTTIAKIVATNSINDPESLRPGDRIKIQVE